MEGAAPRVEHPRRAASAVLLAALLVLALFAVTLASRNEARRLVHHRGTRAAVTPADSGLNYETVPFAAIDGARLEGWWIVPKDGVRRPDLATVILCHPEDDSLAVATGRSGKARVLPLAVALSRAGFLVLAFDFRSYGGSAGGMTTGGWQERRDLAGAIEFAGARSVGAPLVLYGMGMGANVALSAGGEAAFAGAGIVQVLVDAPRATWDAAILDRAQARRGAFAWLATRVLEHYFIADELPGDFDGDAVQAQADLASSPDSALVVLANRPGAELRAPAEYRARVVRTIEARLDSLTQARVRADARTPGQVSPPGRRMIPQP